MKLIVITQQADPLDPVLGATAAKLRALARRADALVVLTLGPVPADVPPGVRIVSFGAPRRWQRGVRLLRALAPELRGTDAVLAHMCPIYAVLAAPLARARGVPVVLWFAHWRRSLLLRAATRLVQQVLSVDARSFPLATPKLKPIGHGIDYAALPCRDRATSESLRVLVLGRYSPAKGLDTIVRAVALVPEARLLAHGTTGSREEEQHLRDLHALVAELRLEGRVAIRPAVPRDRVSDLHADADVLVNNMRAGAPDKAVYEACGGCLPVLASNPSFDELFAGIQPRLRFDRDSPDDLAERLRALAAAGPEERARIGRTLRERAVARHSVDSWADGVVNAVRER